MAGNRGGGGGQGFFTPDLITKASYRLGAAALAAGAVMLLYDPAHGYQLLTLGAAAIGARLGGHLDSFLDRPPQPRVGGSDPKKVLRSGKAKALPATSEVPAPAEDPAELP